MSDGRPTTLAHARSLLARRANIKVQGKLGRKDYLKGKRDGLLTALKLLEGVWRIEARKESA